MHRGSIDLVGTTDDPLTVGELEVERADRVAHQALLELSRAAYGRARPAPDPPDGAFALSKNGVVVADALSFRLIRRCLHTPHCSAPSHRSSSA
jgi:hypothetical protein